jgi:hypothetical protein
MEDKEILVPELTALTVLEGQEAVQMDPQTEIGLHPL